MRKPDREKVAERQTKALLRLMYQARNFTEVANVAKPGLHQYDSAVLELADSARRYARSCRP